MNKDAKEKSAAAQKALQEQVLLNLNNRLHENFWVAYDALEIKNTGTLLMKGIQMAKET